jgi:hypothetical protein
MRERLARIKGDCADFQQHGGAQPRDFGLVRIG